MEIQELLVKLVEKHASDLHLRVPSPPVFRIDGVLTIQEDYPPMTPEDLEQVFAAITSKQKQEYFQREHELDFAYAVPGLARFRVNVLLQRGTLSIAFRMVPFEVPSIDKVGLPPILRELVLSPRGLILVTGHTGSGKSTTLAAMINHLNHTERRNIITIEDPLEFLHHNDKSIIAQRDLGDDTASFASALMHVLRHDPDVIVIGEMRDLLTMTAAITAAETGHLVMGTLHTTDASQTIDRVIDIFPPDQQQQIAFQLSTLIVATLSQTLLPRLEGGRVAAFEIMTGTPAVRNLIRERKAYQIPSVMELSSKDGMQTLDQALADLVRRRLVARDRAMMKSSDPEALSKLLKSPVSTIRHSK